MIDTLFADWNATTTILLLLGIGGGLELQKISRSLQEIYWVLLDIKDGS